MVLQRVAQDNAVWLCQNRTPAVVYRHEAQLHVYNVQLCKWYRQRMSALKAEPKMCMDGKGLT